MLIIPSWAIGTGFILVVYGIVQIVARRLGGRPSISFGSKVSEADVARLTQALDEVQRRLGELEERVDFAERLLAKERAAEQISPPRD